MEALKQKISPAIFKKADSGGLEMSKERHLKMLLTAHLALSFLD